MLELITADRPGLLSRVGRAFVKCDVQLQNAKIAMIGARVDPAAGGVCVRVEPCLQAGARKGRIRLRGKTPTSSDQSGPVDR